MADNIELLNAIRRAIDTYCNDNYDFSFKPETPIVRLHEPTFSADEAFACIEQLLGTFVTQGPQVKRMERDYAYLQGCCHGVMNNSGSSANLLAIAALCNPVTEDGLRAGDEVIVSALSWSTTIWPLIQYGLVPVVVDIDPLTLNIDPSLVESAIGPKTRAVMPVHVYGNPCDMDALTDICRRHNLILIEDCCEAMGAYWGSHPLGSIGRVGTFSFYYSHHISTLEGGICVTNDFELSELMRILRAHGWIREVEEPQRYLDRHPEIDPKFLFVNIGYNLRATEVQAAMGLVQLPKLANFVEKRRTQAAFWQTRFLAWEEVMIIQKETPKAFHSWFGIPVTIKREVPFTRTELRDALAAHHIETRPIIAGNIAAQPAIKLYPHRVVGSLTHADHVMYHAFSFGNHQALSQLALDYVADTIESFLKEKGIL